jgi:hypothetical protein
MPIEKYSKNNLSICHTTPLGESLQVALEILRAIACIAKKC